MDTQTAGRPVGSGATAGRRGFLRIGACIGGRGLMWLQASSRPRNVPACSQPSPPSSSAAPVCRRPSRDAADCCTCSQSSQWNLAPANPLCQLVLLIGRLHRPFIEDTRKGRRSGRPRQAAVGGGGSRGKPWRAEDKAINHISSALVMNKIQYLQAEPALSHYVI